MNSQAGGFSPVMWNELLGTGPEGMTMETREPFKRGMADDDAGREMDLPEGTTCADCAHCRCCCMMFGHIPDDEVCDWSPSKFQPKVPNAPELTCAEGVGVE